MSCPGGNVGISLPWIGEQERADAHDEKYDKRFPQALGAQRQSRCFDGWNERQAINYREERGKIQKRGSIVKTRCNCNAQIQRPANRDAIRHGKHKYEKRDKEECAYFGQKHVLIDDQHWIGAQKDHSQSRFQWTPEAADAATEQVNCQIRQAAME